MLKNKGPKMEPCGIPVLTSNTAIDHRTVHTAIDHRTVHTAIDHRTVHTAIDHRTVHIYCMSLINYQSSNSMNI